MYLTKSLAIGLPLSRTDTNRDGSCPSVSNGVDPPTFYTLCKHLSVFFYVSRGRTSCESDRCVSQTIRLSSGLLDMYGGTKRTTKRLPDPVSQHIISQRTIGYTSRIPDDALSPRGISWITCVRFVEDNTNVNLGGRNSDKIGIY